MVQIGKDYYEDLTAEKFADLIDQLAAGEVPTPGSQTGRYAAEPATGLTSLQDHEAGKAAFNASVQLAVDLGDTVKRIDGSEVPLLTPWLGKGAKSKGRAQGQSEGRSEDQNRQGESCEVTKRLPAKTTS